MTGWAVEALIASAMLMAVVLVVRVPVRRLFGPQIAYALWALPALRMVTPPLPADWREQAAMPISRAGEAVTVLILPTAAPVQAATTVAAVDPAAALPWGAMLAAAWLLGAGAFFLLHLLRHRQFCRRLLKDARTLDEIDGVRVIETAAAAGPLAFGMARRFVAFPDDFADRYDADERELALAHELGHHARGDLIANWAALALLAVHWFNPLAWRAFRAFRCDQELANDARVLAGRSRTDRHIYACAIVKAAHGGAISAACHLHTIADLKGRLKMLTNIRPSRARLATGAAAVLGVVVTGLAATASGTQAAAAITERVEQATGGAIAAPATVPPAPAAPVAAPAPVREGRAVKRVVVVGDGRSTTYEGKDADRVLADHRIAVATVPAPPAPAGRSMPAMPPRVTVTRVDSETIVDNGHGSMAIRSGDCRPVDGNETVLHREEQGRRVTIICNNRISVQADTAMRVAMASRQAAFAERQAAMAGREADRAQRQAAIAERRANEAKASGLKQAIAGIQMARASIENDRNLSGEQRTQALAGLDDAMREVRRDLAD